MCSVSELDHINVTQILIILKNPEGLLTKKCIYSFFKNVSSSDDGTYHCAVVTCGEIFSENGSKLDSEGNCHCAVN